MTKINLSRTTSNSSVSTQADVNIHISSTLKKSHFSCKSLSLCGELLVSKGFVMWEWEQQQRVWPASVLSILLSLLAGSCSVAVKQALLRFSTISVKLSPPAEFNSPSLITSLGVTVSLRCFGGEGGAWYKTEHFGDKWHTGGSWRF